MTDDNAPPEVPALLARIENFKATIEATRESVERASTTLVDGVEHWLELHRAIERTDVQLTTLRAYVELRERESEGALSTKDSIALETLRAGSVGEGRSLEETRSALAELDGRMASLKIVRLELYRDLVGSVGTFVDGVKIVVPENERLRALESQVQRALSVVKDLPRVD